VAIVLCTFAVPACTVHRSQQKRQNLCTILKVISREIAQLHIAMHQRACKQDLYVPQKTKEFYEQKSCSSMVDVHVPATTRKSCPAETKYPP
jgi:transcription initiation factor TFIIIB Brf1 subunit/transcription initiation factor TFIIB